MPPTSMITRAKHFSVDNLTYKPPKLNKRGGKNIYLQYEGHNLFLQFPKMKTWGVNERIDEDTGRVSYDFNLQFVSKDGKEGAFFDAVKALENKVLDDASKNSKLWFGKTKMSREVAENLMYPLLKFPKNKETGELDFSRHPTVKVKLPYWDNKFNLELYDMDKQLLFAPDSENERTPLELVPTGSQIKGILECAGIWFVGGRFGVSWRFVQGQVEQPVRIKGFCMMSDSEDEEDCGDGPKLALQPSSDDEDAKPKKKVVRRKKKSKAQE